MKTKTQPFGPQLDRIHDKARAQLPDIIADLRNKAREHAEDAPRREAGYSISNADTGEAVVRIYDEIWYLGVNALDLAADLDSIQSPKIRVEINSPGGDVWDGIAIYNALRMHPAEVTTRVDGIAASIASVIAQAGDHRIMLGGSQMMIHNAWGLTIGNRIDHAEMAGVLEHQDGLIADIYATASTHDADHFRALMDSETWMTAEEAVSLGLADEVINPERQPADAVPSLTEKITTAASVTSAVISDVETLVADSADAGVNLTTTKREGLVALRDAVDRLSDLLTEDEPPPPVVDDEIAAKRLDLAKRENEWRASLPVDFLA